MCIAMNISNFKQTTIIALTESAGVEFEDDTLRIIGNDSVSVFQNNQMFRVSPGSEMTLEQNLLR